MKNPLTLLASLGMLVLLAACGSGPTETQSSNTSGSFAITGELITLEPEPSDEADLASESVPGTDETSDGQEEKLAEVEEPIDWSLATIVVTHEVTGEDGEIDIIELASSRVVDDKITLTGTIDEPTEVNITASEGDEELTATALLTPNGEDIAIVLIDDKNEYPRDGLYVIGESRMSKDPAQKFTVTGDFSELERDLSMATVGVFGQRMMDGEMTSVWIGHVMTDEGKFYIEADVADVTVVSATVSTPTVSNFDDYVYASSKFIVEPNADYQIQLRATDDLIITSGTGKHGEIVESWQQSDEYQSTLDAYEQSYVAYMAEEKAKREAAEQAATETDGSTLTDSDTEMEVPEVDQDDATAQEPSDELEGGTGESLASTMQAAEGCEHVEIDQTHRSMSEMFYSDVPSEDDPEHIVFRRELTQIQDAALQSVLDEWSDPIDVLLAMELGAIDSYDENREDAFVVYDKLATQLDPEIVEQRVTPARDRLVAVVEREENDNALLQGQKVPAFTLANAGGEDVVLYNVLAENEVTLIDFWASWCGPCIASFPDLKRLYAAYRDHGFEIVGVSIDDNFEDWNAAAIEQDLPWIDVGELKDWEGPVAVSYGVGFIPKAFLVDPNGCVLKKNVHPEMLEEALVQRFGEVVEDDSAESGYEDSATDEMGG